MDKDELNSLLKAHETYLHTLTEYIRKELYEYRKETELKKAENHGRLVLIIGYTVYFTTWSQLKDVFSKPTMKWAYVRFAIYNNCYFISFLL